jgi:FixJ family two-component response regulator
VNYLPRRAAIVASNPSEADFAESTVSSFGFEVSRHESPSSLTSYIQSQLGEGQAQGTPDIAILTGTGNELARASVEALANMVPVMITTSSTTVENAVDLMKGGAKDVVMLPCSREELLDRVQKTLETWETESACKAQQAEMQARLDQLTPAENEVVDAMLDGLANKQIAQRLGIGLRTVELRRSKIMRKMHAKSVAELVKFICVAGRLKIEPEDAPAT